MYSYLTYVSKVQSFIRDKKKNRSEPALHHASPSSIPNDGQINRLGRVPSRHEARIMMAEIIIQHQELIPADRLAHVPHDRRDLRPPMHAVAVEVPLVAVERERPLAVPPRLDAHFLALVAVVDVIHALGAAIVRELAAGHAPAVLRQSLAARDALFDGHGGSGGAACPVEGVDVTEVVGVVLEVHVGGELGLRVGVEVFGGAGAGCLAKGVEVLGPPDWVPDLEVFEPVALMDGAGVGCVPGLEGVRVVFSVRGVGEDGSGLFRGIVGDPSLDVVEDDDRAGGWSDGFPVGDDGKGWNGGCWIHDDFGEAGRLGGSRICRRHRDHGGWCGRSHCRSLHE